MYELHGRAWKTGGKPANITDRYTYSIQGNAGNNEMKATGGFRGGY